jgi:acyl transferase domain-containing protein
VVANINSQQPGRRRRRHQGAVEKVVETFLAMGMNAVRIPVSHAFHTSIVAPASEPFVNALRRLDMRPPKLLPIVANVTGEFYPRDATTETMLDFAGKQIASPVQFVKGLKTLYAAGARVFVEVGPKKALHGFVEDVSAQGRRAGALHQPPQAAGRCCGAQPGALRSVRRRHRDSLPAAPAVPAAPGCCPRCPAAPARRPLRAAPVASGGPRLQVHTPMTSSPSWASSSLVCSSKA